MPLWLALRKWQETLEGMSERHEIDEATYVREMNTAKHWNERLDEASHRRTACRMKRAMLAYFEEFSNQVYVFHRTQTLHVPRLEWKQFHASESARLADAEAELRREERADFVYKLRPTAAALAWAYLLGNTWFFWVAPLWLTGVWASELRGMVTMVVCLCAGAAYVAYALVRWSAIRLGRMLLSVASWVVRVFRGFRGVRMLSGVRID